MDSLSHRVERWPRERSSLLREGCKEHRRAEENTWLLPHFKDVGKDQLNLRFLEPKDK